MKAISKYLSQELKNSPLDTRGVSGGSVKNLWKLTPPFFSMIPSTEIQAADIISESLNPN